MRIRERDRAYVFTGVETNKEVHTVTRAGARALASAATLQYCQAKLSGLFLENGCIEVRASSRRLFRTATAVAAAAASRPQAGAVSRAHHTAAAVYADGAAAAESSNSGPGQSGRLHCRCRRCRCRDRRTLLKTRLVTRSGPPLLRLPA